jgi:uncharacterized membrane protein YphA (DoxX/SURF4 family)
MTTENVSQAEGSGKKTIGRYVTAIARILLGLIFLALGVIGLLKLMAPPKEMPENIRMVLGALDTAGYMQVVSAAEFMAGLLLLINRFVPLALALLAPVVVGILTFHIFLQPATIIPGIAAAIMELYLAWAYRGAFRPMLRAKTTPGPN